MLFAGKNWWPKLCCQLGVKRAVFKVQPKNGFIRSTLCPVNDRRELRLTWGDLLTLAALVIGGLALARVLLAH
jgi:hypothetical protein